MWSLTQMDTSLIFFQANLEDFFTINWNQQYSQFNSIKVGKNNGLTIFSIQLCLRRYFSQRDMVINFLWKEIRVGKEMATLAKKCCFSNPLMRSDDLSLFESFGLLYQRKCIIPWSCIKFFFFKATFIKPSTTWNAQTQSCLAAQYLMASTSKEGWRIFCLLISKGEISRIRHLQMPASQVPLRKKSHPWQYLKGVHRVSSKVLSRVFIPIYLMRERWKKESLGNKRLWKTLFWGLYIDTCVLCRDRAALIIHSPEESQPGLMVRGSQEIVHRWEGKGI